MGRWLFLGLLAGLSGPAAAQGCGGETQLDLTFCAKQKWQDADDSLNRVWADVKPAADGAGTGEALLAAQRVWLAERDATCEPELSGGGSIAPMLYWTCMERMTRARTAELRGRQ